jgi:NAD+ synthase (glutamine-hydrolysing)
MNAPRLRLVMAQVNPLLGDIDGNARKITEAATRARDRLRADAVVFPELALIGYPPADFLFRTDFLDRAQSALTALASAVPGIGMIVGHPHATDAGLFNAASYLRDGRIVATYHKHILPNYAVFDEKRYFTPGHRPCVVDIGGVPVGITICEDAWTPGPMQLAKDAGARVLVNLNASPYHLGKHAERLHALGQRARETALPIVYVNLVGGQDELVFDGDSLVVDGQGALTQRTVLFEEELAPVDFDADLVLTVASPPAWPSDDESLYGALVLGLRDYVEKNRFPGVVLGLSGGVDSALVAALAVDALGSACVQAVMMPSRYTSAMSLEDARAAAQALGIAYSVISIEPMFDAFLAGLREEFAGRPADVTEENMQARIRAVLLMAIANKSGSLLLTTGNKSEIAVGYTTLYGDAAGGFAPIKDVFKTRVYALAAYRNARAPVIPARIIARPPSAELAPNQTDQDSLPPYVLLDGILARYIEHDQTAADIVAAGYDATTVARVIALVQRAEHKRRQSPPGARVSPRAFGLDWRYPITGNFRAP